MLSHTYQTPVHTCMLNTNMLRCMHTYNMHMHSEYIYKHKHARTCIHSCIYMYAYTTQTCIHIYICIRTYIHKHIHTQLHACIHISTCTHTYTYICAYIQTYEKAYIYAYICAYMHAYVHTYIRTYTYMHTYIHAYLHTCIYLHPTHLVAVILPLSLNILLTIRVSLTRLTYHLHPSFPVDLQAWRLSCVLSCPSLLHRHPFSVLGPDRAYPTVSARHRCVFAAMIWPCEAERAVSRQGGMDEWESCVSIVNME